jgi:hypothetical protein
MTSTSPPPSVPAPSVARFALCGALGFGIGGVLGGLVQASFYNRVPDFSAEQSLIATAGYAIMGIVGGAALGLARRDTRALYRFALVGLLGFGVGGLLNLMLVWAANGDLSAIPLTTAETRLPNGQPITPGMYFYLGLMYLIAFLVRGVIGGAVFGLAVPHRRAVRFLSLMGGIGFGLGGVAGMLLLNTPGWAITSLSVEVVFVLWLALSTGIGGAFLGGGVGALLRRLRRS